MELEVKDSSLSWGPEASSYSHIHRWLVSRSSYPLPSKVRTELGQWMFLVSQTDDHVVPEVNLGQRFPIWASLSIREGGNRFGQLR
jgi:hypothetical protein